MSERPPLREIVRILRDAVMGRGAPPTDGPVLTAIVLLAVPMVLEMVMESVFAVVDIFFVSRLGAEAVTAVGITESLMALVYTVAIGLSIGVTAVVARRTGEGDREGAAIAAAQAILLGVLVAAGIAVIGLTQGPALLRIMGAGEEVVAVGADYTRILLGANVVIMMLFLVNAAFRGVGDAAIAMRVLWIANLINIVLDPLLIFGIGPFPELGVAGAAVATTIGRGTGVLLQLATLFRWSDRLRLRLSDFRIRPEVMARVVRLSASGTLQTFVGTASWIGIIRILASFGPDAVAGYTIAIRVVLFALLPAWGLGNAASTMVGQSLGAGDADRAERSVWIACFLNLAVLGLVGVFFMVAAGPIASLFGAEPGPHLYATQALRIISLGFFFYAFGMVLTAAFNGAGDTWTPTWINLICFWLFEIPCAAWLALGLGWGPVGVFWAVMAAFSLVAVVSGVLFRRGRWKTVEV